MIQTRTPIAFFTYNRPAHAQRAFETLAKCARLSECDLHIFQDGLRLESHRSGWEASQSVITEWAQRLKAVSLTQRKENLGVAKSIVSSVTELCREYGRIIVIEDDFVLNPDYIRFMLEGLDRYENEQNVYQISGYMFPVKFPSEMDAFLMPFTTAWGWATWQRAWQYFEWAPSGMPELLADVAACERFNLNGGMNHTKLLRSEVENLGEIYDVRWYYAVFRRNGLVVHPSHSLVWNGGMDGSGSFSKKDRHFPQFSLASMSRPVFGKKINWPENVKLNVDAYEYLTKVLRERRQRKPPLLTRFWHRVKNYLKQV